MAQICAANCEDCDLYKNNNCNSCQKTKGCPFGKKCWIANYIAAGGKKL